MFYPKNVPNWERLARLVLSLVLIALALFGNPTPLGLVLLIGSAVLLVGTAFIGWCPACALVGRKLKKKSQAA